MQKTFLLPKELKKILPLPDKLKDQIASFRQTIKQAIYHPGSPFLLVNGPCSIHSMETALVYGEKLQKLSEKISPNIFCVMRVFIEKSRSALGWKGFLSDPFLTGQNDLIQGIYLSRQLFLAIAKMGIPIATEMLDPLMVPYFDDLISWYFIGARLEASPIHRYVASSLDAPVGFKNGLDGFIEVAHQAIEVTKAPCQYLSLEGELVTSQGNPYSHLVLRGSHKEPNLHLAKQLDQPFLIDCSHGNCPIKPQDQNTAFLTTLQERSNQFMGWMVESFLESGKQGQKFDLHRGCSLTDPCLDFQSLEFLALAALEHSALPAR